VLVSDEANFCTECGKFVSLENLAVIFSYIIMMDSHRFPVFKFVVFNTHTFVSISVFSKTCKPSTSHPLATLLAAAKVQEVKVHDQLTHLLSAQVHWANWASIGTFHTKSICSSSCRLID